MAELVEAGSVIVDLIEESRLWRHLDRIARGRIERVVAADIDRCSGGLEQGLGARDDLTLAGGPSGGKGALRQAIALGGVEDREALQEWNGFRLIAVALSARTLRLRDEPVGINDGGPALAFAHCPAQIHRLPEGQPTLIRIGFLNYGRP